MMKGNVTYIDRVKQVQVDCHANEHEGNDFLLTGI
jgi:hypothetical protein